MNSINVMAPINSLGYGVVGLNVSKELAKNAEVSLFPIGNPEVSTQEDASAIQSCIKNQTSFDAKAPCLRIWHQFAMAEQIGNGLRCGLPIFELDAFNENEMHHLNSLDKIFVCSDWAKGVVVENLYNLYKHINISQDVHVCPLGVDRTVFFEDNTDTGTETRFINIGKWEFRKGHDVLVEAFEKAFEPSDNVKLYMMNHNPFLNQEQEREWVDLYKNSKMGERIEILPRVQTHQEVANVIRQMDCGVFPSRAEGWNLEAIEMLSCGKQLIATDYSAHTEFCTKENSRLIEIEEKESAYDGIWFHGQGMWAELGSSQIDQLVEHLRAVHKEKQSGKLSNEAGIKTAKEFSWQKTTEIILENMEISQVVA